MPKLRCQSTWGNRHGVVWWSRSQFLQPSAGHQLILNDHKNGWLEAIGCKPAYSPAFSATRYAHQWRNCQNALPIAATTMLKIQQILTVPNALTPSQTVISHNISNFHWTPKINTAIFQVHLLQVVLVPVKVVVVDLPGPTSLRFSLGSCSDRTRSTGSICPVVFVYFI